MFEIEYSLTLEDEINSLDAQREYLSQLPLLFWQNDYILPLLVLSFNIPNIYRCLTTNVPFYTNFAGTSIFTTVLNLLSAVLLMPQIIIRLPTQSLMPKYNLKRSWSNNPEQIKLRKIIVTNTELVFNRTETYMFLSEKKGKTYQWQKLRKYLESDRGFFLGFTKWNQFTQNTDSFFIPRSIFTSQKQINIFRELLGRAID